jgi:predicted TIM-barrel fold metal-dependent hydrolase
VTVARGTPVRGGAMTLTTALPIIDAHQHFWDLERNRYPWLSDKAPIPFRYGDYSALRRTYLPADFRTDTVRHGVAGSVHIEAEFDPANPIGETDWLVGLAAAEGLPSVCVAQAWLDREDVAEVLAAQAARPLVRGIRHKPRAPAGRGAPGSMDCAVWRAGYALLERHGLSFDLQAPWWQMDAAADLARDFPATQIVINHTALPVDRSTEALVAWRAALAGVAVASNVALKISGLGQPGVAWTYAASGPLIRDAIGIFGVERCMFASNFPVDSLVASYDTIVDGFLRAIEDRSDNEQRLVLHDNARRIYRM